MPRFRESIDGREVEIFASRWTGRETIKVDGRLVSDKSSTQSWTAHGFEIVEKGGTTVYEIDIIGGFRFGYVIRRNGLIVAATPKNSARQTVDFYGPESNEL